MRTILIISAAFALSACHRENDLWVPPPSIREVRYIQGIVVDENGNPITEARIDYHTTPRATYRTNESGRFELMTTAPALVVRKQGYGGQLFQTESAANLRIIMRKEDPARFPVCVSTKTLETVSGFGAQLYFPRLKGVKYSNQGNDIDYGQRWYGIKIKNGEFGVQHAAGPLWSSGYPTEMEVWDLKEYRETNYAETPPILDARGVMADGRSWRFLGRVGESASYSGADKTAATILDQLLDSACLGPH